MDGANATGATTDPSAAAERLATGEVRHESCLNLTRGQQPLTSATAAAVLVFGINALVQLAKAVVQCWPPYG